MNNIIINDTLHYRSKDETSDFHVIIDYDRIACHRKILECSPYIKDLLNPPNVGLFDSQLSDNSNELELPYEQRDIFEIILASLYDCKIDFTYMKTEHKLLLLEAAHLYRLYDFFEIVANDVESSLINYENILILTKYSEVFKLIRFRDICYKFIETNIKELTSIDNFVRDLSKTQLVFICNELELYINDENDILQLVERWIGFQIGLSDVERREIRLSCIRLNGFSFEEFNINFLGLLTLSDYQYALQHQSIIARKQRIPDIDFSQNHEAIIIFGHNTDSLLNGQNIHFEKQNQFPYYNFYEESPIVIDLGQICLINYIALHLFDGINDNPPVNYSYSYYVETSISLNDGYFRVIDHSDYICRSKQKIYFYPREVRYVRICGDGSYTNLDYSNNIIHLRSFSCRLTDEVFDISRGLWAPNMRITVSDMGCFLAEGENCPEGNINWMLRPGIQDTNYTFHKIGGGNRGKRHQKKALLVHLPQPIYINQTLTHLVEDCIYAIQGWSTHPNELTLNQININQAMLTFDHSLMLFLKIKGYYQNNDRFKCADFSNVDF